MRILVFSDSHTDLSSCIRVLDSIIGVDLVLHAGDHARDAALLARTFPDLPVEYVRGNCDHADAPAEKVIEVSGKRIFLTHGHLFNVKSEANYDTMAARTLAEGCDLGVFGHTHREFSGESGGVALLNPGSIRYGKTYGVIEIIDGFLRTAVIPMG